ncbi:hypothetical protein FB451DRAFT_1374041 [Mycena latifolia]|nr:hypothetical protein FB451DRAFT_1374041 [Mycena latifolia]
METNDRTTRQAVAEREVVPPWSRCRKWWCSDAATPASAEPGPTLPTQRVCRQRAYSNQLRADAHADAAGRQSSIRSWINSSARTAGAVPIRAPAPAVGCNQIFVKNPCQCETPKSDGIDKGVTRSIAEGQLVCIIVCMSVVESQVWFLTRARTGWKTCGLDIATYHAAALAVEYILSTGSNYNPEWKSKSNVVELQSSKYPGCPLDTGTRTLRTPTESASNCKGISRGPLLPPTQKARRHKQVPAYRRQWTSTRDLDYEMPLAHRGAHYADECKHRPFCWSWRRACLPHPCTTDCACTRTPPHDPRHLCRPRCAISVPLATFNCKGLRKACQIRCARQCLYEKTVIYLSKCGFYGHNSIKCGNTQHGSGLKPDCAAAVLVFSL